MAAAATAEADARDKALFGLEAGPAAVLFSGWGRAANQKKKVPVEPLAPGLFCFVLFSMSVLSLLPEERRDAREGGGGLFGGAGTGM